MVGSCNLYYYYDMSMRALFEFSLALICFGLINLCLDELKEAIVAFKQFRSSIDNSATDENGKEAGGVIMRLRGGGGKRKNAASSSNGISSGCSKGGHTQGRAAKRSKVVSDDDSDGDDSDSNVSGYESSSAYSCSEMSDSSETSDEWPANTAAATTNVENKDAENDAVVDKDIYMDAKINKEKTEKKEKEDDPKDIFAIREKYLQLASALRLPGNPLDTLIDQLGKLSSNNKLAHFECNIVIILTFVPSLLFALITKIHLIS